MIPKKIHYCWFGGNPLPKSAKRCIDSWKKFLPDYEIIEWNENNFDVDITEYSRQAYKARKFAFVSDYARFWILYKYGGLYFDTDVELIGPIDDIIGRGPFMGCENPYKEGILAENLHVAPGLGIGSPSGLDLYKRILNFYESTSFVNPDGQKNPETVVTYVTRLLCAEGFKSSPDIQFIEGIYIYPSDYFCPISTYDGKLRLSQNTRSIHHYDQTWQSPIRKLGRKFLLKLGGTHLKKKLKNLFYKE